MAPPPGTSQFPLKMPVHLPWTGTYLLVDSPTNTLHRHTTSGPGGRKHIDTMKNLHFFMCPKIFLKLFHLIPARGKESVGVFASEKSAST